MDGHPDQLSPILHFLDPNFEMKNYTLQARQLCESHTGEILAKVVKEAIELWNLKRRNPVSVTTDNASNIVSGVSIAEGVYPHIRCFAHTLNLATQRGIHVGQMDRIPGRVRRIVIFFHRSSTASGIFSSQQQLLELPAHKLIMDVSTRWNSTYDMVARYVE